MMFELTVDRRAEVAVSNANSPAGRACFRIPPPPDVSERRRAATEKNLHVHIPWSSLSSQESHRTVQNGHNLYQVCGSILPGVIIMVLAICKCAA